VEVVIPLRSGVGVMRFLDDGEHIESAGDPAAIAAVNQREGLRLRAADVEPYLCFYVESTSRGRIRIARWPADLPWLGAAAELGEIAACLAPLRVTPAADGDYRASFTALALRDLVAMVVRVRASGEVVPVGDEVVVSGLSVAVPFPVASEVEPFDPKAR
jgi:hypothetical protein